MECISFQYLLGLCQVSLPISSFGPVKHFSISSEEVEASLFWNQKYVNIWSLVHIWHENDF